MNSNLGSHFSQQCHQHPHLDLKGVIDPTTEQGIVKGLSDFILWTPLTPVGYAAITSAMDLIDHLQQANKRITEDPYLALRKFGEEMLGLLSPHHTNPGYGKQIFFYNYPNNEVYFGFPANLETETPPVMMKSVLGTVAAIELSLDEAIAATKRNTDIIQTRVFGMPLQPATVPNPETDWEFILTIGDNPLEWEFKAAFQEEIRKLGRRNTGEEYNSFKEKFNISAVLNDPSRPLMDFHVRSVNHQLHWEWITRK